MGRPLRILQDEYPYHITTRTNGRVFVFKKWTYKLIIKVLVKATKRFDARIHHFKMMTNHYHLLLTTPSANVSEVLWFINNQIAKLYNRKMGITGHLWGERFHSTITEKEEHAIRCVIYLYRNGVRAGMCRCASEDEQLSTFGFYARGKKLEFIVTEDDVFLMLGKDRKERQEEFVKLVDQPMGDEESKSIRCGLRKMFYGSADFVERMKAKYCSRAA